GAIALAGDDNDAAGLQGDVRDQGISDHDGGDLAGKPDELGLVDIDRDGFGCGRGETGRRPRQDSDRDGQKSKTRKSAVTLGTERHTLLPRDVDLPAKSDTQRNRRPTGLN